MKKGISLIVLIVTIIVIIIIAGAVIISLSESDVIEQGKQAVETHNIKTIEEAIGLTYQELLLNGVGTINVDDLASKVRELSTKYSEIQNVIAGTDKVMYMLTLTGKQYEIDVKTGKIIESVEITAVPFTNYIENGPYYYVYSDGEDDFVITISKTAEMKFYTVRNNQMIYESIYHFEIKDKLTMLDAVGISAENIESIIGVDFDSLNEDTLVYDVTIDGVTGTAANVFENNYTKMMFSMNWYTLDTSYPFPEN